MSSRSLQRRPYRPWLLDPDAANDKLSRGGKPDGTYRFWTVRPHVGAYKPKSNAPVTLGGPVLGKLKLRCFWGG